MLPLQHTDIVFYLVKLEEGVGFEPTEDITAPFGFQDRPDKPLWHPSIYCRCQDCVAIIVFSGVSSNSGRADEIRTRIAQIESLGS